jgi:hypothetical protein
VNHEVDESDEAAPTMGATHGVVVTRAMWIGHLAMLRPFLPFPDATGSSWDRSMGLRKGATVLLFGSLLFAVPPKSFSDEGLRCEATRISVQGVQPEDLKDGCTAVVGAVRFLEAIGLSVPAGIRISIVEDLPVTPLGGREIGRYDATGNAISILAFRSAVEATREHATEEFEPGLARITTRSHWRSYFAHEMAHAAIHGGCDATCPSRAMHEYVAAVAQIASLPGEVRHELLSPYRDLEPFGQVSEITETYYAINPQYFAAKAYKHFMSLADPRAFLRNALRLSD